MSSDGQDEASRLGGLNSLCTQTGWLWSSVLLTFWVLQVHLQPGDV